MPKNNQKEKALTRINTVLNKVRSFTYEPGLVNEADWLVKLTRTKPNYLDDLSRYRALSLAIEIYNEYAFSEKAKSTVDLVKAELEERFNNISPDTFEGLEEIKVQELKSTFEQACWISAGAALTHYWYHEIQDGLKYIQQAISIIELYLSTEHKGIRLPCYGIIARLSYYAGLLYIETQNIKNAQEYLRISQKVASARLSHIEEIYKDQKGFWKTELGRREALYTTICVAKIQGYGFSMIHQLAGELEKAEDLLEGAELVLRQTHSPTMAEMVRLRLFKVRRSLVGRDAKKLDEIIKEMKKCYQVFSSAREDLRSRPSERYSASPQNRFYASLAAFEISLSNIYKAQGMRHENKEESKEYKKAIEEAIEYAGKVTVFEEDSDSNDNYWKFAKNLLLSRIQREYEPKKALDSAEVTLEVAQKMKRPDLQVDALIAIGEAMLKSNRYNDALSQFQKAAEINKDKNNDLDRIRAVCSLRKAEAYIKIGKKYEAVKLLDEWELLSKRVEFKVIHFIADKVRKEISDFLGDFRIPKETTDLKLSTHYDKLRDWLVTLTLKRHKKTEQEKPNPKWLRDEMGISLSQAYSLINELNKVAKKAQITDKIENMSE